MTRRDRFGTRAYLHRRTRKRPSARGVRRCDASIGTWGWVRRLLSVNKTQSQVSLIAHTRIKCTEDRSDLFGRSPLNESTSSPNRERRQPLEASPRDSSRVHRSPFAHRRPGVNPGVDTRSTRVMRCAPRCTHPRAPMIRTCFQSATMIDPSSPLDRSQNPSPDMPNTHPPPQVRHHADGERQLARGRVHQATRALRRIRTRVRQRDHPHPRGETHDHRVAPGA